MATEKLDPNTLILVAESEPASKSTLKRFFREFQLNKVTFVEDFYKAMHQGRLERQELVFISSSLSKGNSVKLLAAIRREGKNTKTPIVFLYSKADLRLAELAHAAGASARLEKPLDAEVIREVIESSLDKYIVTAKEKAQQERQNLSATEIAIQRGKKMLLAGDFHGAEAAFEEAMVTGGGSVEVFCGLAEVYLHRGNFEGAEQVLKEAERIDPNARREFSKKEKQFLQKGSYELKNGEFHRAKREFECAIAVNNASVEGYAGLSESLEGLQESDAANDAFDRALGIDCRPESLHVYNRMGMTARRKRDFKRAVRCYDRALSFDSTDPVLHYNKSMVYVAQNDYRHALALLNRALEIEPDFTEAKRAVSNIRQSMSKR